MSQEDNFNKWTKPSSDSEKARQDRTESAIRDAVQRHAPFSKFNFQIYAKGSYPNNTNVRLDSDVDIAVLCKEATHWSEEAPGAHPPGVAYSGIWTPTKFRTELTLALETKFPGRVDSSGTTAFRINSTTTQVQADVVPCFDHTHHFSNGSVRKGAIVFKKDGTSLLNYADQQLANGIAKNNRTSTSYKKTVRIFKRIENLMLDAGYHREVPSFLIECLLYNCPDSIFRKTTWTEIVKGVIQYVWSELDGTEPAATNERWLEINECKWLFDSSQKWTRKDGRDFVAATWNYLGLK